MILTQLVIFLNFLFKGIYDFVSELSINLIFELSSSVLSLVFILEHDTCWTNAVTGSCTHRPSVI